MQDNNLFSIEKNLDFNFLNNLFMYFELEVRLTLENPNVENPNVDNLDLMTESFQYPSFSEDFLKNTLNTYLYGDPNRPNLINNKDFLDVADVISRLAVLQEVCEKIKQNSDLSLENNCKKEMKHLFLLFKENILENSILTDGHAMGYLAKKIYAIYEKNVFINNDKTLENLLNKIFVKNSDNELADLIYKSSLSSDELIKKIFISPEKYLRLKKLIKNKIHHVKIFIDDMENSELSDRHPAMLEKIRPEIQQLVEHNKEKNFSKIDHEKLANILLSFNKKLEKYKTLPESDWKKLYLIHSFKDEVLKNLKEHKRMFFMMLVFYVSINILSNKDENQSLKSASEAIALTFFRTLGILTLVVVPAAGINFFYTGTKLHK